MPIPSDSVTPLSIGDIAKEFDIAKQNISFSSYFRGEGKIPSGLNNIPQNGEISISDFYGVKNTQILSYNVTIQINQYSGNNWNILAKVNSFTNCSYCFIFDQMKINDVSIIERGNRKNIRTYSSGGTLLTTPDFTSGSFTKLADYIENGRSSIILKTLVVKDIYGNILKNYNVNLLLDTKSAYNGLTNNKFNISFLGAFPELENSKYIVKSNILVSKKATIEIDLT